MNSGDTVTDSYWPEHRYNLVRNSATEVSRLKTGGDFRDRINSMIVVFHDVQEYSQVGIVTGFASVNNSIPDVFVPRQVEEYLDYLCSITYDEPFEAGMESRLSRDLQRLCMYDPNAVLQSLRTRLMDNSTSPSVSAEILQWASRQEATAIRTLVVDLLSAGLHHPSSLVRDAAASGLAYLDEDAAIIYLRQALEREGTPELREDLEDLIHSLET